MICLFLTFDIVQFHDNGDVYDETGYPKEKLYPEKEQDEAMQMLPDAGGKGWELKLGIHVLPYTIILFALLVRK